MKKVMLILLGFILGMLGTSYAAYKLKAEQVSFDNNKLLEGNNVQEAIDEISYLIKDQIGTTDISSIGDGTITGALMQQKEALDKINTNSEKWTLKTFTLTKTGQYVSLNFENYIKNLNANKVIVEECIIYDVADNWQLKVHRHGTYNWHVTTVSASDTVTGILRVWFC